MARVKNPSAVQSAPAFDPAMLEALAVALAGKIGTAKPTGTDPTTPPTPKRTKKTPIRDIGTFVVHRSGRDGNVKATEYSVKVGKSGNPYLSSDRAYNPAASVFDIMDITANKAGLEWFTEAMGVLRAFYAR